MAYRTVTIQVPGSTSNIGPGYDCLGIALGIYNRMTLTRADGGREIHPPHGMVRDCARMFFKRTNVPEFAFCWGISGEVPVSRGLGSSVTVRLGVLAALNELCGQPLTRDGLFALCSEMEGHPDNAGPAAFGGFVLTSARGESFRFEVGPELKFVLLIPDQEVVTEHARRVLPPQISHREAVLNMGNACIITAAFATQQYAKLRDGFEDYLHQRYRAHLVPGLFDVIEAGASSGALGGFLSGSGSTIACLALGGNEDAVAAAMLKGWKGTAAAETRILTADNLGATVLHVE
jgi:homoserine kinase